MSILESESVDFLTVCPRDSQYMDNNVAPARLRVIQDGGVNSVPDVDIIVNDLASGRKHFQNNSGKGDTFKVNVLINTEDTVVLTKSFDDDSWEDALGGDYDYEYLYTTVSGGKGVAESSTVVVGGRVNLLTALDYWMRTATPLNIVTRAVDVPNGVYLIIGNSSRKQTHENFTEWELEFMKYDEINTTTFVSTSTGVTKAIAKYEKAKKKKAAAKKKTTTAKSKTSTKDKLKKCKLSNLKYSKTKKVVTCVKYLQKVLNSKVKSNLIVDGWYGSSTKAAVKKFQTNNKKYNLKTDGNVDKKTLNCLCGSCKK